MERGIPMALVACVAGQAAAQTCAPYWSAPGLVPQQTGVNQIVVFDDGTGPALYASAVFDVDPNGYAPDPVRRWRGGAWERVGPGQLEGNGHILAVFDDGSGSRLYSIGTTTPIPVPWYLRWDGQHWVEAPPAFFNGGKVGATMPVCTTFDTPVSETYGFMTTAPVGTYQRYQIVRWVIDRWLPMGPPGSNPPTSFLHYDSGNGPELYQVGVEVIGGVNVSWTARWDGSAWRSVNAPALIRAACVYDDGSGPKLYVGGDRDLSGLGAQCIACWDGTAWASVGGGVSGGINSAVQVNTLAVFDDGSGPALYAAGAFTAAGGVPARNIARWDGHAWRALGSGIGAFTTRFASMTVPRGPSLFMCGTFQTVGGGRSPGLAQWVGCPSCYANCDTSTVGPALNVLDFVCFLNKFAARDPYANCTGDGAIDVLDFSCFLNRFAKGCP